ncbi:VOC family protein [Microbaculum marinum]|uniref:VOC family protein n=1 Tax=Microbaculum marinum TaxID=1764581 RepID=A0AAW9RK68_9HYPH
MKTLLGVVAAAAMMVSSAGVQAPASAEIPGMTGMDHVGITVPDIGEAETFFVDIVGCEKAMSFGPFRDDTGTFMQDLVNVHPRAVIEQISLVRCGHGSNIELFQYTAPDQTTEMPKNSDHGGHHLAFYVEDIDAAAEYFKENGIRTLMGPFPVNEGPAAGQTILYFFAPWGLQLEAISYPDGMAYEKDGGPVLWSTRAPAE